MKVSDLKGVAIVIAGVIGAGWIMANFQSMAFFQKATDGFDN